MLVFVLGQFIYLTHPLSLWHCFPIVAMHPRASPSGIGFSKLESNSRSWWTPVFFAAAWKQKGIFVFRLGCVPVLLTAELNPYCAQEMPPLSSPLRVPWLRELERLQFLLSQGCLSWQQLKAFRQMSCSREHIQYIELQNDLWPAEESFWDVLYHLNQARGLLLLSYLQIKVGCRENFYEEHKDSWRG